MGAKRDDCPEVAGTSTRDVQGCIDSDGDGWSDEYGSWNAAFSIMGRGAGIQLVDIHDSWNCNADFFSFGNDCEILSLSLILEREHC